MTTLREAFRGRRWCPLVLRGACVLALVTAAVAQFDGERRRGDLTPMSLPGGSVVEFKAFDSRELGKSQHYSIFLPPSYSKDTARTYPVVYFLHGLNNDHTSWTVDRYGNIQNKVEELIVAGKIPEILMVHPHGDNSFYCNYADGRTNYEDFVARELVRHVESTYRAKKGRENRSIGGTSMGGYGALKIAMKRPDLYASAVGHSPIIFLGRNPLDVPEEMQSSRFYQFFSNLMKPIFGDPFRQELWDANNPLLLAKSSRLNGLRIHFDYGTDDRYIRVVQLDRGVKALDRALREAGAGHSFREYAGEPHGWALVSSHIHESLPFLCQTFR